MHGRAAGQRSASGPQRIVRAGDENLIAGVEQGLHAQVDELRNAIAGVNAVHAHVGQALELGVLHDRLARGEQSAAVGVALALGQLLAHVLDDLERRAEAKRRRVTDIELENVRTLGLEAGRLVDHGAADVVEDVIELGRLFKSASVLRHDVPFGMRAGGRAARECAELREGGGRPRLGSPGRIGHRGAGRDKSGRGRRGGAVGSGGRESGGAISRGGRESGRACRFSTRGGCGRGHGLVLSRPALPRKLERFNFKDICEQLHHRATRERFATHVLAHLALAELRPAVRSHTNQVGLLETAPVHGVAQARGKDLHRCRRCIHGVFTLSHFHSNHEIEL